MHFMVIIEKKRHIKRCKPNNVHIYFAHAISVSIMCESYHQKKNNNLYRIAYLNSDFTHGFMQKSNNILVSIKQKILKNIFVQ